MDEYIRTYGRRLFGLCLHLCRSRSEAEDLYQDTWLRLLEQWARYDPSQPFEPWAARVCVNLYRDRLRRLRRQVTVLAFPSWEEQDRALAQVAGPEAEDYTPPTLTQQSLEAERDRRAALRQRNLCLALTALLTVLFNLACWVLLLPYLTTPAGLAAAVGLIASELAGLAALAAFAIVRRDRQWHPLAMF